MPILTGSFGSFQGGSSGRLMVDLRILEIGNLAATTSVALPFEFTGVIVGRSAL